MSIPVIMPRQPRIVSDGQMDVMKRLLMSDVPRNLLGMAIFAFILPFNLAFAPQGDGTIFWIGIMAAGVWNALVDGKVFGSLIFPDLVGNRRIFRTFPVSRDTLADAIWIQRVGFPCALLFTLFLLCLLVAAPLGKLSIAFFCRALSGLGLAYVLLCAAKNAVEMRGRPNNPRQRKKHPVLSTVLSLLSLALAILFFLSMSGYVAFSLLSVPAVTCGIALLGVLCVGYSWHVRRKPPASPVQGKMEVAEPAFGTMPVQPPWRRFLNGIQPLLEFSWLLLCLNLFTFVVAFFALSAPALSRGKTDIPGSGATGALLAIATLFAMPNPAVPLRVWSSLPIGRRRLVFLFVVSALLRACMNISVPAILILCIAWLLPNGTGPFDAGTLCLVPMCLAIAAVWYPLNFRDADILHRILFILLACVAFLVVPLAPGKWMLCLGVISLPVGIHYGFQIARRVMNENEVYRQPAWELLSGEPPRSV